MESENWNLSTVCPTRYAKQLYEYFNFNSPRQAEVCSEWDHSWEFQFNFQFQTAMHSVESVGAVFWSSKTERFELKIEKFLANFHSLNESVSALVHQNWPSSSRFQSRCDLSLSSASESEIELDDEWSMVGRWMGWIDYYLKEIRRAREWAKRRRAWMRFDGEVEMFWLICSLLHFSFSCWCFQNLVYRSSCWSATSDSDFIVKSSTIHYCLVFSLHFLFRTWSVKQSRSFARVLLLFWSHLIELSVDFFLASLSHSIYTLIRVSTCRRGKWKWIDRRYKFITHSAWSILILIQFSLVNWMLCCWLRTNGFNVKSAKSVICHHRSCHNNKIDASLIHCMLACQNWQK